MFSVIAIGYELLSSLIPFLIMLVLFRRVRGRYSVSVSNWHHIFSVVFAMYIIAVFHITGAGTLYDGLTAELEEMKERINLIPFSNEINVTGYLLNVVMFFPLGFIIPLIWKQLDKLSTAILSGLSFSLLIELSQLLSYRGTDIDDLITNTIGAVIGYILYKIWDKLTKSKYQCSGINTCELPVYILVLFLGRFILFNYVGLIDFVYGY